MSSDASGAYKNNDIYHELGVYILKDKSKMQEVLAELTRTGDLILFANDAPNFI